MGGVGVGGKKKRRASVVYVLPRGERREGIHVERKEAGDEPYKLLALANGIGPFGPHGPCLRPPPSPPPSFPSNPPLPSHLIGLGFSSNPD